MQKNPQIDNTPKTHHAPEFSLGFFIGSLYLAKVPLCTLRTGQPTYRTMPYAIFSVLRQKGMSL